MKVWQIVVAVVVVGVFATVGLWNTGCGSKAEAEKIVVGYSKLRISLPIFVAQEKGFFAARGLQVELMPYDTAQPLLHALIEGKIPAAGYTALPISYAGMMRSEKGLYFATCMVEDQQHRISFLLRKTPEAGEQPAVRTIQDLKGKTVGILPTVAYKGWLQAIVKANGLDPDRDIKIQQVEQTLQLQTLVSGGVDALFTNDPVATAAIASGKAELILPDTVECPKFIGDPFAFGSFNVNKAWADANPEAFKKLIAALDDAIDYINAHPEEVKQMMVPYIAEQFRPHVAQYPNALYTTSVDTKLKTLQDAARMYVEHGILDSELKMDGLVVSVPR